jgi:hypothetical protein
MTRFMLVSLCWLIFATVSTAFAAVDLKSIDRKIAREPEYHSQPRYCLLVFGPEAKTHVWLVEDGKRLFVDRNANGDLTDDGEPAPAVDERNLSIIDFDTNQPTPLNDWDYEAGNITAPDAGEHTGLHVMRWKQGDKPTQHGVLINVAGKVPTYSGWGHVFADKPADAPIMHFGGEYNVTPLRNKSLGLDKPPSRFSIGFFCPGAGDSSSTRISIKALPEDVIPLCEIEWPAKDLKAAPIKTELPLNQRCCYWEFYNTNVTIPDGAGEGKAKITITMPDKLPFKLGKQTFELPVVAKGKPTE